MNNNSDQLHRNQEFSYFQSQHSSSSQNSSPYDHTPPTSAQQNNDFQHMTLQQDYMQHQISPESNVSSILSPPETRHNSNDYLNDTRSSSHFQRNFAHYQSSLPNPIVLAPNSPNEPHKFFTENELKILKELLPVAETHKWKYISNKVSKSRAKKMNSEFCSARFHEFFQLPHNKSSDETNIQYLNNNNSFYNADEDNLERIIGSSLAYMVHPNNPY